MKRLKIAFIGYGSIAERHIHNLKLILDKRGMQYSIDLIRHGSRPKIDKELSYIDSIYYDEEIVPKDFEIIFVTNPTHLHFENIKKYISFTKHMFIEKPIFNHLNYELDEVEISPEKTIYVACPLRFTEIIKFVKSNIKWEDLLSLRAISSSYLPEWRPNKDYRMIYSSNKEGGGVTLDLIHEWDYIIYLLGKPKSVTSIKRKVSDLEIQSDDLSIYVGTYDKFSVEVHLDYFGKYPIREFQAILRNETILVDFIQNRIKYLNSGNLIEFKDSKNDMYISEIEYFLDLVTNKSKNFNSLQTAIDTLKVALGDI